MDTASAATLPGAARCIAVVLAYLGRSVDFFAVEKELDEAGAIPEPRDLVRAARRFEVKARIRAAKASEAHKLPLPCIARDREGGYFILARANAERAIIQRPPGKAETISSTELEAMWGGETVLLAGRSRAPKDGETFGLSWFIPAILRYRKVMGEVLLASFFIQILALLSPIFFQVVIDKVFAHGVLATLEVMVIGLIVVGVFEVVMSSLRTYLFSHTAARIDVELGSKLFRHMMGLPAGYFEARRTGQTVARVRELDTIRDFLTSSALTLLIDVIFTVVFLVVMWIYSPVLTLIVLGSLPIYAFISLFITAPLRARMDEQFRRGAENQAFLTETVAGAGTLKALAVEPHVQREWEERLAAYAKSNFAARVTGIFGSQSVDLVQRITSAILLFFGAKLVIAGSLTVGQFVAFNMFASRVAQPILRVAQLWQDFQQARIGLKRLGDILNAPREPGAGSQRSSLPTIEGRIDFEDVTFRYGSEGVDILRGFSMRIEPGESVALVGPSGSGKTTIAKLLQRLYIPQHGRVLVDGIDVAQIDASWLRRQIGVAPQEPLLFSRSVRENIALGQPSCPMERIVAASRAALAHEFISDLQHGYDTVLVERGANLSGGQRQRLAIARALLFNPRILILDEPTSALDADIRDAMLESLPRLLKGRTILIITHDPAVAGMCHRTIRLDRRPSGNGGAAPTRLTEEA